MSSYLLPVLSFSGQVVVGGTAKALAIPAILISLHVTQRILWAVWSQHRSPSLLAPDGTIYEWSERGNAPGDSRQFWTNGSGSDLVPKIAPLSTVYLIAVAGILAYPDCGDFLFKPSGLYFGISVWSGATALFAGASALVGYASYRSGLGEGDLRANESSRGFVSKKLLLWALLFSVVSIASFKKWRQIIKS